MKRVFLAGILVATQAAAVERTSVRGSKHDLSVTGPGPIRATREADPCVFCHTMHGGMSTLIGRPDPTAKHRPYESETMRSRPNAPTGASRICLSCHDGTIAVGQTRKRRLEVTGGTGDGRIPASRRSNLGTDLRQSHPVSIVPSLSLSVREPVGRRVRLDQNRQVQCTSCHDPHSEFGGSKEGMFLLQPTHGSALCGSCHTEVMTSSHLSSAKPFPVAGPGETQYSSVGESGCMACHRSHGAATKGQLVRIAETEPDEVACLRCHSSSGPGMDVARDAGKPFSHQIQNGGRHDAAEGPESARHRLPEASIGASRHATCVDCHDGHQANGREGTSRRIAGALDGVWGVDEHGRRIDPAEFEYQICFKCHGDSANQPQGDATSPFAPRRRSRDVNLRRVFAADAPSSHPVIAPGRNADVPSLRAPLTAASLVRCTDCHASDTGRGTGGNGPRGPHGSTYPALLERQYATADFTSESPAAYALCYKCHDRDVLLSDRSAFRLHRAHVIDRRAPCSTCHVAHGVSAKTGTSENNAHLVDFDVGIVSPAPGGLSYASAGTRSGSCTLTCHGHRHDAARY